MDRDGRDMSVAERLALNEKVTPTEAKVLEGLVAGKSRTAAVQAAGIRLQGTAAAVLAEGIKKKYTDANGYLLVSLENAGVNFDSVAKKLKEGLDATTTIYRGRDQGVEAVPDFNVRHKYLETALDVMGAKAPKKQVTETKTTHEETIAVVEGIRDNPLVMAALRRRIEQRSVTVTETFNEVEVEGDVEETD